uniref:DUF4238 domain-containing protein n=1 Tax=Ruegeria arenilitoris TaxID=1173585 RepID=UPI003463B9B7
MIPRVYLENFSEDDGRLTVYSKRREKTLRPKPKDALIRAYYYSQPEGGIENAQHAIETDFLGGIETNYPELIEQISSRRLPDLELLYLIMYMMRSRSPAFREAFELGLADKVNRIRLRIPKSEIPTPPVSMPDLWENLKVSIDPHRSLIAMAYYVENYLDVLFESRFQVAYAPRGQEFLTSDNPVVWYDVARNGEVKTVYPNLPNQSTRVVFPLTKKIALVGRYRQGMGNSFDSRAKVLTKNGIRQINEIQLACAWDEIVGNIRLPKISFNRFSKVAPKLHIAHYNSDSGAFVLSGTSLGPLREKAKFSRKK